MASTNTILKTIEWAKKMNFNRRSAIGNFLEPALTSANIVKQAILGPPFEWRFNRKEYAWTLLDPASVAWIAVNVYPLGFRRIDSNGNIQTVTSIGTTPFKSGAVQPTWSTDTVTPGTTTDGNLTWTVSDPQTYVQLVSDFGWIEHASVKDITLATPKWIAVQPQLSLSLDSSLARPRFVSAHTDDNAGNIGFVFTPQPDKAYPFNMHIQKKAALFTSINDTWAPIPDEFSYIYNWGFLALMWLFADDPRFQMANQKFVAHLLGANEGLTETEKSMFLGNWGVITGTQNLQAQQGNQARSV